MKCPYCNNYFTIVEDSREIEDGTKTKRKRKCTKCDKKFTTHEVKVNEQKKG
jgi:transcriptional repressor NrdR